MAEPQARKQLRDVPANDLLERAGSLAQDLRRELLDGRVVGAGRFFERSISTASSCGIAIDGQALELANAASNAAAGGLKLSLRKNASASGAPSSRSIPESSHSTETGPS
jgi:hypothetical protein